MFQAIIQTWENDKKPNFGLNFDPKLDPKSFFVSLTSTRC